MTRYQYVIFHDGTIDAFMEKEPRLSFSDPLSSVYRVNSHVLNSMLCKVVKFKIKFTHGSIITGKGTFVYGAGGNKDSIIIITDDREMNRKIDMRFTFSDIAYNMAYFLMEVLE